ILQRKEYIKMATNNENNKYQITFFDLEELFYKAYNMLNVITTTSALLIESKINYNNKDLGITFHTIAEEIKNALKSMENALSNNEPDNQ
ncbi:MAG: hypothetical protein VB122_06345, partial [Erysipelotrichales bacterium]|nr:hypothetical protein [Erysipelotrichales bacterium]